MASYEIVPIDGITQTTVQGTLDFDKTADVLRHVAAENEAKSKHLLIDLRAAESTGLSYPDVYRLVQMLGESPGAFSGRIALLDRFRAGFEKVQFFEASATEQGFSVRAFLDESAAVDWLEAAPEPA